MKVVDSGRMAAIDREAQRSFAIPEIVLMEDAGRGIFESVRDIVWNGAPPRGPVVFLCGRGNNGGDALVVARHCRLAGINDLAVVLGAGEPPAEKPAGLHLKIVRSMGIRVLDYTGSESRQAQALIKRSHWLIDGLLGTGLSGEVRSPMSRLIRLCNEASAFRIAVDIPSGIGDAYRHGYIAYRADCTLTVQVPKLCLYLPYARGYCGTIHTIAGVFPPQLLETEDIPGRLIDRSLKQRLLVPLNPETHKGGRGHVAVFAGSEGTTGAAWLSSTAAARARAGLVTLFIDRELYGSSLSKYGSVMLRAWRGEAPELDRYNTLLVGPGWGTSDQRQRILGRLLASGLSGVLDADGISLLARLRKEGGVSLNGRWILTPHPGELSRLLGTGIRELLEDPLPPLLRTAAELQAIVVLKGHCSYVASPEGRYGILDGMNPAMATGGSGDVLAGMCAGLLASGCTPEDAATLAVRLHSEIGRKLYEQNGCFLAEDMLPAVSAACGQGQGSRAEAWER